MVTTKHQGVTLRFRSSGTPSVGRFAIVAAVSASVLASGLSAGTASAALTASDRGDASTSSTGAALWLLVVDGSLDAVYVAVRAAGGTVVRVLPAIGQAVVRLDAASAASLRTVRGVRVVSADRSVKLSSSTYDAATDKGSPALLSRSTGARDL